MDQEQQGQGQEQIMVPECVPIFLPSWVIGRFSPRELAVLFALQSYGANLNMVGISKDQLATDTRMSKKSLMESMRSLQDTGWIDAESYYDGKTKDEYFDLRSYVWDREPEEC